MTAVTEFRRETAAPPLASEQRILIPRVDWEFYIAFSNELARGGNRSVRLTYDRGSLEIMTTGRPHERFKTILAKLVEALVFELRIAVASGGQMTFRREDLQRGLESDECWWIAHEVEMRGREDYIPLDDPPPDLALEIEISNPLLDKFGVYAKLGVPEIWRFDGRRLEFWQRRDDSSHRQIESSVAFPFLRPEHLLPYLRSDDGLDETTRLHRFVEWLREHMNGEGERGNL